MKPKTTRRVGDKASHIDAVLDGGSEVSGASRSLGFDDLRFKPRSLPETNLEDIDLSLSFLKKKISAPLMISPMTGGFRQAGTLNRRMAKAAERFGIPFGVGSQRVALERSSRAASFQIRSVAPTIPVFANLGAVQLMKGYGAADAQRAVDMIEADALYLHLNAMQEVVQQGGDTQWKGVLKAIERLCRAFRRGSGIPVFAREVGFGIARDEVKRLIEAGVQGIDCAGGGGTSWTMVEARVARSDVHQTLGRTFAQWGLTTVESIVEARNADKKAPLVASGGVRSGLDVAKCVGLGATIAGMASPILRHAVQGQTALEAFLNRVLMEIRVTLFGVGAPNLRRFRRAPRLMGPKYRG